MLSARLRPIASTRMRTSPAAGCGSGTSLNSSTSGAPKDANSTIRAMGWLLAGSERGSGGRGQAVKILFHSLPECKNCDALADSLDRSLLGLIPFHPLVRPPHVPAMDAGAERCEFSRPRRVGAEGVLRVLLPERSGGYRFLEVMASPDCFSHRLNQLTQIGQVTAKDRPRSQQPVPRNNCPYLERVRELCHGLQVCACP